MLKILNFDNIPINDRDKSIVVYDYRRYALVVYETTFFAESNESNITWKQWWDDIYPLLINFLDKFFVWVRLNVWKYFWDEAKDFFVSDIWLNFTYSPIGHFIKFSRFEDFELINEFIAFSYIQPQYDFRTRQLKRYYLWLILSFLFYIFVRFILICYFVIIFVIPLIIFFFINVLVQVFILFIYFILIFVLKLFARFFYILFIIFFKLLKKKLNAK